MKPYLVVTHDYKRQSAGVRALHKLAHYLNLVGQEAYVTSEVRNADWITPLASPKLQVEIARCGIVVYPEVEAGNKLGAKQVVRFLLNIPGRIRGDEDFPAEEQLFCYSGLLRRYVHNPSNVLTVPVIDLNIFNTDGFSLKLMDVAYWVGRCADTQRVNLMEHNSVIEITQEFPSSWEYMAELFRQTGLFISYANYTMLIHEARLCGCPTMVIPNGLWTKDEFARAMPGISGLAWGTDKLEIEHARRTVKRFWYDYQEMVAQFYVQLARFVDVTQRWHG